ncbi:MAG: diaminohydroxyphosphoribosylaminopyrimidine reductase [Anaerolineaceae bacterium]|nr:2,5-diamino-6-(ribosylamino)-4(3H)-pyrimidinone 5'-phosphate reductase [Chloroflexota bacterium]MCL4824224.1 dihydrofolate reductase family protein [Anaerolineales bacterium]GJQ40402.1 MAG: diaminohydroxyphosphoribosylaminopyrimidine reductase [Anaerolineaceae bacterium]NOG76264.1 2,5-diamino-6-(ribosylamino)-4(3H)-pyrimidinone 5'-phosphate reductase [Chloroflexota bacterium]GIK11024.1 MAG: diaminohydroxyphosphoribosylaminopyrimidine reductase [Chloroflexota bacterium]
MNRPFVFINVAVTADGKMDTYERRGAAVSSARDKARVDRLRAGADAVMVGGKTLLEEDPRLTVKSEALRAERAARGLSPNPMKVGIVSNADELPDGDFVNFGAARVVIFAAERTSKARVESLRSRGVEVYVHDAPRVDLVEALRVLRGLGVERLMVEGGGTLNFELLRLGLVDELTIYVASMIFGGESAPTLADGVGLARGEAIPLKLVESEIHADGGVVLKYARATGVL